MINKILITLMMLFVVGQQCNWESDCGFNETCRPVVFSDRGPGTKTGICVPEDW